MRKLDLVRNVADAAKINQIDALIAVEAVIQEIKNAWLGQEELHIRGFGAFIWKKRAAKVGRNIKRHHAVAIPEHHIPFFKPAPELKRAIKKLSTVSKRAIETPAIHNNDLPETDDLPF